MPVGADLADSKAVGLEAFAARLREHLAAARALLERPGFGVGPTTLGAELELSLVDAEGRATMRNRELLDAIADPRLTVELDRFNLEINADPVPIAGAPFAAMAAQLRDLVDRVDSAGAPRGVRPITIGTLPSLELSTLADPATLTDLPRYHALDEALRRYRGVPFELEIDGEDPLNARCEGVTFEGANTSLQIHVRVDPGRFADAYNAAQLATPVAVAVAGNSPLFCGHRLWEETRIAVFKQSVDMRHHRQALRRPPRVCFGHGWAREGIYELLAEGVSLHEPVLPRQFGDGHDAVARVRAGQVPPLRELRLHLGTIWRWNRPIFETAADGHLRIELRALPSGPTIADMMASGAFAVGLTLGLRDRIRDLITAIPFEYTRTSFYRAAQRGLDAELAWPARQAPSPELVPAADLALRLIPVARQGLIDAGVSAAEVDVLLSIIGDRVHSRQTGARWQRRALEILGLSAEARAELTLRYLALSRTGAPVHTWPLP